MWKVCFWQRSLNWVFVTIIFTLKPITEIDFEKFAYFLTILKSDFLQFEGWNSRDEIWRSFWQSSSSPSSDITTDITATVIPRTYRDTTKKHFRKTKYPVYDWIIFWILIEREKMKLASNLALIIGVTGQDFYNFI